MDKKIENIVKMINEECKTNFKTENVEPLIKITLKKMLSGKSFEESFKEAIESSLSMRNRFAADTKRGKLARELIFKSVIAEHQRREKRWMNMDIL